jgi:hypothetical protein
MDDERISPEAIVEHGETASFGSVNGTEILVLKPEHIEALRNGKIVSVLVNGGEYRLFIVLE